MDDLISRQAAKKWLARWKGYIDEDTIARMQYRVKDIPSAQPERKKGTWIHIRDEEDGNSLYECSLCHMGEVHVPIVEVRYCWNCGADMR